MARALSTLSPEQLLADSRWLRSLARGLAGEAGADDLVSDTWLSAARRPPRFWDNLRPWLRTVARNLSLRERDREARRRERELHAARPENQPSTADLVGRATLRRSVVDAVLDLPEPYRTTILLRFFEELPPREVARRLDVPVATVRTRISRGLERLRSRLDRERGSQGAWIAMLVPAKGLLAGLGLTGALVMGTKAKVAGVAAVLLLGALGWWQWSRVGLPAEQLAESGSSGEVAQSAAAPDSAPVTAAGAAPRAIRPQRLAEANETGFAIVGTVVDDRNDRPVEGVAASHMGWGSRPETAATGAKSDLEGKFRVAVHQRNQMRGVTLLSPDYAPLVVDHLENQIRQEKGDRLDLGTVRLLRGARVSGRVVWADTKEPIPDAPLLVCPRGYPSTQSLLPEARSVGRSGADGSFVLSERVAPNQHEEAILCAVTPDGVGWTFLAIVKDREDLSDVEIVVSRGASVRVIVVDEAGNPVEGAFVHAVPRFPPLGPPRYFGRDYGGYVLDRTGDLFSKKSGADGVVAFRGLPIGRTDERFRQYFSPNVAYDVRAYHEDYAIPAPVSIDVDPSAETATTIKLSRRTLCAIRGRVTNESGSPIEGANIGQPYIEGVLAKTDPDGAYRTAGQDTSQAETWLEVRAAGCAKLVRRVPLSTKGEDVVADFVLQRATPIKGRVIDQDGKPVPSAYVDLLDGRTDENRRQLRPDANGQLDGEGRFVFSEATAGPWTMRVHGDPDEDWIPLRERTVQGGDQNVVVVLRRASGRVRLEAEIVDAKTGAPVDPAETHLRVVAAAIFEKDSIAGARPRSSVGRVTAEKLSPGKWSLFVRLADGSRVTREFTVKPDDTVVKLRIEVGKPASVTVKIDLSALPADARPTSVAVWTNPPDAAQWMSQPGVPAPNCTRGVGVADASNGWSFLFGDVTPDVPIRIWTSSQGGRDCRAEAVVTVAFGEQRELVLRPALAATITFRKPDQAPAGGVIVSIKRPDGTWDALNWSAIWESGKEWKFKREVLAGRVVWRAERYALETEPTERVPLETVEGELDIAAGESRDVPIVFRK